MKNQITFKELTALLNKGGKAGIEQEKWNKNISEGEIEVKKTIYTLMATDNKRQLIFSNNKLVGTKPYIIKNKKLLTRINII